MILVIDNFDSFTYNIVQYLKEMRQNVIVKRNDEISTDEIETLQPKKIVLSPGPSNPDQAGICLEVVQKFKNKIPLLGICLGHQVIAQAYGGKIIQAKSIYHGKTSPITHDGKGIFFAIPNPSIMTRYHSLVVEESSLPPELLITARSDNGEIMGIRDKNNQVEGIQFHPESIASKDGYQLLSNFLTKTTATQIHLTEKINRSTPQDYLKRIIAKENLNFEQSQNLMNDIADGKLSPVETASLLTALAMKGEVVDELTGFAYVMRKRATKFSKPKKKIIIDTCGTGGDKSNTFNISTISAIVAAGAGAYIAKHGNRSITSQCGSADLLEGLGVNLHATAEQMEKALNGARMCFMFAPNLHSSMKHVGKVRKELGIRTIFNILGPLANPMQADRQLIGVFDINLTEKLAQVLKNLGVKRSLVVHGYGGLDEISLSASTKMSELKDDEIITRDIQPEDFGLVKCQPQDILGGNLEDNLKICRDILSGQKGPTRDIVLLNAAATIFLSEVASSFKEGVKYAAESIDTGAAKNALNQLIKLSHHS